MAEWEVVGVLVVLVGLVSSIAAPVIKLNNSITKLTVTLTMVQEQIGEFTAKNTRGHERLWAHNEEQDRTLNDHERRLTCLERDDKEE